MSVATRPKFLPRIIPLLYVLFLLFAVCLVWHELVTINEATKAVRPEESPHMEFLVENHDHALALLGISEFFSFTFCLIGALASLGALQNRTLRWTSASLFLFYGLSVAFARFIHISGIAIAGIDLFVLFALYEALGSPDMEAMVHFKSFYMSVGATNWRGLLRFLIKTIIIFAVSGIFIVTAETLLFTARIANHLFTTTDLESYLLFVTASSALACATLSVLAVLPAGVVFLFSHPKGVARGGMTYLGIALAPTIWFALVVGGIFFGIIYSTFSAEIWRLGLLGTLFVLSFIVAYLLLLTTYINFKFILKRVLPPRGDTSAYRAGDYAVYLVLAMVAVPLLPFALLDKVWPRRMRIHGAVFLAAGLLSAGALIYIAGFMNYPMLTEYSYGVQGLYSIIMIGATVCTIFILARFLGLRRSPRLMVSLPVLAVMMLSAFVAYRILDLSQNMRYIINEYAPLGRTIRALVTGTQGTRLGMDVKPEGEFRPYGSKHDYLPSDPGLEQDFVKNPPPVIYIILDAARPDKMRVFDSDSPELGGMYCYKRDTTPTLREFAREASIFTNAYAASTATSCSMKNIFSGCFATRSMTDIRTPPPFFTTDLLDAGYGRFFINYFYDDQNGVSMRAFTRSIPPDKQDLFVPVERYDEKFKVNEALEKIAAYEKEIQNLPPEKKGYFVYLHFCTTHFPWKHFVGENYYPSAAYYGETNEDLYDEATQYADLVLEHFLDGLKKIRPGDSNLPIEDFLGVRLERANPDKGSVYDRAVIIVTADHGTGLNEHGKYGGFFSYQEQFRVPLFIKIPGVAPKLITEPVTAQDIAPTIVNLVERGVKNRFDGVSLLPLLTGKETTLDREFVINICAFHDSFALIQHNRWKLIYYRDLKYYMLYDLQNDPHERHDLADEMPDKCRELIAVLERFLWQGRGTYANPLHYE
jgi:hypothetical protein